mmetsp:Transcript_42252/g.88733  ORF Transcript_42252/g.88733 Transcript_42252/m.88733 type:complete len:225 (-) Transcript_42252:444-1118(-)
MLLLLPFSKLAGTGISAGLGGSFFGGRLLLLPTLPLAEANDASLRRRLFDADMEWYEWSDRSFPPFLFKKSSRHILRNTINSTIWDAQSHCNKMPYDMLTNPILSVRMERVSTLVTGASANFWARVFSSSLGSSSPPRRANATASLRNISAALPNFPDSMSPSMLSLLFNFSSVASFPMADGAFSSWLLFLFFPLPLFPFIPPNPGNLDLGLGLSFMSMHCGWK